MAERHDDHEDDYMRGMDAAEAFVAGGVPDLDDLDISDHEVTYRRADFGSSFLASRFDSLDHAEFLPQTKSVAVQFTAATGGALDDGDDALFLPPKLAKSTTPVATPVAAANPVMPTGDVPDARAVGYHCVNPSFESEEAPPELFRALLAALEKNGVKGTPRADWSIGAFALVAAEEVYFNVQLHRLPLRTVIRVDFNMSSGDEMKFLSTVDKILSDCRSLDKEMKNLPDLSFDFMVDWSDDHDDLFASSPAVVDIMELDLLLKEVQNKNCHPFMRYEAAKSLKDLCQYSQNRSAVAGAYRQQFIDGLNFMLQDDDEDIVRFAIYAIQNFANDRALASELQFPGLPETLQHIKASSKKASTKNLADDLYAIVAPVS